jgi:uncharacterized protein YrzB (UPF0473 family)
MSDINDKDLEEFDEDEGDYITLTDDDGNDVSFEILDTIEYKERLFAVLLPFDDQDDEVVILEILPGEDPEFDDFVSVDDEELLNEVFEEFKKKNEGEFDFT